MESYSELIQKIRSEGINDQQRTEIYSFASLVSKDCRSEICPAIFEVLLESAHGLLKNELGRVIFHLQKNERLDTIIGLEKLLDAALQVAPEELFRILENSGEDSKDLAERIKSVL